LGFIESSFHRDREGNVVFSKEGKQDTRFYKGVGSYYLFNTCNAWTAEALQMAEVDIDPSFMFTAGQVISRLRQGQ